MSKNCRSLERVTYCLRPPSATTDILGREIEVRHAYPYNPSSKTAGSSAESWAKQRTNVEPTSITRSNDPFPVTIIDLHHRSQGGRAYKVIDPESRCFDLREDQVMEVMRDVGIQPGGVVPGNFVWGQDSNHVKLVLCGGELHRAMVDGSKEDKTFEVDRLSGLHPTEGNLRTGHVYRERAGGTFLFLGRVQLHDASRTHYAFLELPERPSREVIPPSYDPASFRYKRWHRLNEIHDAWGAMTWRERCEWSWYGSKKQLYEEYPGDVPGYWDSPGNIILMMLPKFVSETEDHEPDLAAMLRENAFLKHPYVNGHGTDLSEHRWCWLHNGGKERPSFWDSSCEDHDSETLRAARVAWSAERRASVLEARQEFRDALVWDVSR